MFTGPMNILTQTIKNEGFFALYKGMASPLLGIAGVNSLLFASYAISKRIVSPFPELSLPEIAAAGAMAGAANSVLASPVEMFKVRMQGQYGAKGDKKLSIVFWDMWRDYGFRKGVMRGFWFLHWVRICQATVPFEIWEPGPSLGTASKWLLWWYVVKSRVQLANTPPKGLDYIAQELRAIIREGGFAGLFRGLSPSLLRSIPAAASTFAAYELTKEHPFKETKVLPEDVRLATLAFGFTTGFGYFVVWHAINQTHKIRQRTAYIIMCWLEIVACLTLATLSWLFIIGVISHSFWIYLIIVTLWALQLQLLLQIIVSRICILLPSSSQRFWLKFTVAVWIVLISISVYCIWIPAKLQISEAYIRLNLYWDHTEKILYLLTDAALNIMFIRLIRQRLVSRGLKKYDKLVALNSRMIFVSLSMDIIIIGMLSYRNDLVYMQFHPVAFMVKLEIEMCMSRLMLKVAKSTGVEVKEEPRNDRSEEPHTTSGRGVSVHVTTQVITRTDNLGADYESSHRQDDTPPPLYEPDLEGQFQLSDLDPVAKDSQGIVEIARDKKTVHWVTQGRDRVGSGSSRGSDLSLK
ncbi:hypothetical protein RSOLAG22IIIB_04708 [Rhizoctonia solani]|uniref:Uncharacterized protein n=1 Tax=Rhizoctonia solani TaxID=456999 RepID=A0A0K6G084_9AGAM|nr:hypothetical protein RSOLAG22IIIB_04708 [Rhizoctonia solani]